MHLRFGYHIQEDGAVNIQQLFDHVKFPMLNVYTFNDYE